MSPFSSLTTFLWIQPIAFLMIGFGLTFLLLHLAIRQNYVLLESKAIACVQKQALKIGDEQIRAWIGRTVTPTFLERAILKLINSLHTQLQSPSVVKAIYRFGDEWLPSAFGNYAEHYVSSLTDTQRAKVIQGMEQFYTHVFPNLKLEYHQAEVMLDVVFSAFLTPEAIRQMLVDTLSSTPTSVIEQSIKSSLSGFSGLVAKFVDLKPAIDSLKQSLVEEPDKAVHSIIQLLDQLEVREKLAEKISHIDWKKLSPEEQSRVIRWLNQFIDEWLQDDPKTLGNLVTSVFSNSSKLIIRGILKIDWYSLLTASALPSLNLQSRSEALASWVRKTCLAKNSLLSQKFVHSFLKRNLDNILQGQSQENRQKLLLTVVSPWITRASFAIALWSGFLGLLADAVLWLSHA